MESEVEILKREVISKIMLILFTYKDGKMGEKPLGPIAITKLIYPNNVLFAGSIIGKINELEKLGIVLSKREKINGKNYRILYPNFRKFVDIFNEYYNLGLTEEEKDFLAKWFSEVDWSVLSAGVFEKMIREKFERNIIQMVGDTIKMCLDIFSSFQANKLIKIDKSRVEKILKNYEKMKEKLQILDKEVEFKLYVDLVRKILNLPDGIIEKLLKLPYSSAEFEKWASMSLFQTKLFFANKELFDKIIEQKD
ncbi:MAG: hypothetical protein QXW01_00260 [Candidatus Aenigmatarchaeota archaeon]